MHEKFAAALLVLALGWGGAACDSGKSEADLREEIRGEAERLNSCDAVDDCFRVSVGCEGVYVNGKADRTKLEALTGELADRFGPKACTLACACAVLRCQVRKCTVSQGNCMGAPPDGKQTCL